MKNLDRISGIFLLMVGTAVFLKSLTYPIGSFRTPGGGLFPLIASILLIGLSTLLTLQAFLSRKDQDRILQGLKLDSYTPHTIRSLGVLRKELEAIRKTGVATNQQEFHNGITALAAPIFNNEGRPAGSIALVGTSIDQDAAQLDEYAPLFIEAAAGITERIGAVYPPEVLDYWKRRENG